jgi:hypothetical protein
MRSACLWASIGNPLATERSTALNVFQERHRRLADYLSTFFRTENPCTLLLRSALQIVRLTGSARALRFCQRYGQDSIACMTAYFAVILLHVSCPLYLSNPPAQLN